MMYLICQGVMFSPWTVLIVHSERRKASFAKSLHCASVRTRSHDDRQVVSDPVPWDKLVRGFVARG